jgi:hypothetical protein
MTSPRSFLIIGGLRIAERIILIAFAEFFAKFDEILKLLNSATVLNKIFVAGLGVFSKCRCHVGYGSFQSLYPIRQLDNARRRLHDAGHLHLRASLASVGLHSCSCTYVTHHGLILFSFLTHHEHFIAILGFVNQSVMCSQLRFLFAWRGLRSTLSRVDTLPTLERLIKAIIFSALAGGLAYGLTTWRAPPAISAYLVALLVVAISALAALAPTVILNAVSKGKAAQRSTHETYYDLDFSLKKNSGYED